MVFCSYRRGSRTDPPLATAGLCDHCMECVAACPGHAIDENGVFDPWQCGAYYRGANRSKNPFMPADAFLEFENREEIMSGAAKLSPEESKRVMADCYFYPPIKQGYAASICGAPAIWLAIFTWKRWES